MEENINKNDYLNDLKNFIDEQQSTLSSILNELGWTTENLMKNYNENDQQDTSKEDKTKNDDEPLFPPSLEWDNSVKIDQKVLQEILEKSGNVTTSGLPVTDIMIPNRFSDLQINFTREQKLKIYEHVIKNTKKLSEPELPISLPSKDDNEKKPMTFAEILAMKRDLKRRRQKHRTTKNPPLSLTEELRNLIDLHMQAFIQYLSEQNPPSKKHDSCDKKHSSKIDEVRHRSSKIDHKSSSSTSHHHHHHKKDKKRKRSESPKRKKKSSKNSHHHHHKSRSHHKDHKHSKSHRKSRSRS